MGGLRPKHSFHYPLCLIIWRDSDGFEVASHYLGSNLKDGLRGATINAIEGS